MDNFSTGAFDQIVSGTGAVVVFATGDTGVGSLRSAMRAIQSNGTIRFASSIANQTIVLKSLLSTPAVNVTVDGETNNIAISGNNSTQIFLVGSNGIRLRNLTLKNGKAAGGNGGSGQFGGGGGAGLGGALFILGAAGGNDVYLDHVTFVGNQAVGGAGGTGSQQTSGGGGGGGTIVGRLDIALTVMHHA